MTKFVKRLFFLVLLGITICGCLTPEYKEYRFTVNEDGSGKGSITYYNFVSEQEEGEDVSNGDFVMLINDYLYGTNFETENPTFSVIRKDVYERNGELCGIVEFTFEDYLAGDFEKYDEENIEINYFLDDITEEIVDANGEFSSGEDALPIVEWASGTSDFYIRTLVKKDMSATHPLIGYYRNWISAEE